MRSKASNEGLSSFSGKNLFAVYAQYSYERILTTQVRIIYFVLLSQRHWPREHSITSMLTKRIPMKSTFLRSDHQKCISSKDRYGPFEIAKKAPPSTGTHCEGENVFLEKVSGVVSS